MVSLFINKKSFRDHESYTSLDFKKRAEGGWEGV
jgi:hypothetical protein